MNKPIRIVITSLILIAAFFSAALTWEACKSKDKTLDEKAEDAFEQHAGDEFFEDDFSDNDGYESNDEESSTLTDNNSDNDMDFSEVDDKENEPVDTKEVDSYEEAPIRRATADGKYLIVAGNFLVENNANKMVNRLVSMGYSSAEVAVFDYSQYYTVIASRSDDSGLARSISQELKSKGVDSYVHTKK